MLRKEPPRGPKALRESSPGTSSSFSSPANPATSRSDQPPARLATTSSTPRLPTGPKAQTNGSVLSFHPVLSTQRAKQGSGNERANNTNVNRYFDVPQPPSGPAALKNKLAAANAHPTPTGPKRIVIPFGSSSSSRNGQKGSTSWTGSSSEPPPPPPNYDPPPPPPPNYDPPPPPPPPAAEQPPPPPEDYPSPPPPPPDEPPPPPPPARSPSPPSRPPFSINLKSSIPQQHPSNAHPPSPTPESAPPLPVPKRSPSPPRVYTLPLPPDWPPPASEYSKERTHRVLFDPMIDKDYDGKWKELIDSVRQQFPADTSPPRVKTSSKGRETLIRYEGDNFVSPSEVPVSDPRKRNTFQNLNLRNLRPGRENFYEVKYEHDDNSVGPSPPTSVLIVGLSSLTPNSQIRRHFEMYGQIKSFEPQIDMENGMALGVVFIRYGTHEEAKNCVEKENGRKNMIGLGMPSSSRVADKPEEVLKVVMDGEAKLLKAVVKGLDEEKKRVREERRRMEREVKERDKREAGPTSAPVTASPKVEAALQASLSSTPASLPTKPGSFYKANTPSSAIPGPSNLGHGLPSAPRSHHLALPPHLPPKPQHRAAYADGPPRPAQPIAPISSRPTQEAFIHAEPMNPHLRRPPPSPRGRSSTPKGGSSYVPSYRERGQPLREWERDDGTRDRDRHYSRSNHRPRRDFGSLSPDSRHWAPRSYVPNYRGRRHLPPRMESRSRSPSPILPMRSAPTRAHEGLTELLARNGYEHIKIDGGALFTTTVEEDDVRAAFEGFKVDRVFKDRAGWFVTFKSSDGARRAAMVLNSGSKIIAHHTVEITVHSAPTSRHAPLKAPLTDDELVNEARALICKELLSSLEQAISEQIVEVELHGIIAKQKEKWKLEADVATGVFETKKAVVVGEKKYVGISFKKKRKPDVPVVIQKEQTPEPETVEVRPPKRQKTDESVVEVPPAVLDGTASPSPSIELPREEEPEPEVQKRAATEELFEEEPARKKLRTSKKAKPIKKATKPIAIEPAVLELQPIKTDIEITALEPSLSPLPTPVSPLKPKHLPSTTFDPLQSGLCEDDEDMYFARLFMAKTRDPNALLLPPDESAPPIISQTKRHQTGSARTEGFYTISHTEKAAYVDQYQTRLNPVDEHATSSEPKHVVSSRSNRANARRKAQGLEEHHQLQLAVALSKGEATTGDLSYKFNQLQTRKKHLRFARSPIHDWGLYAMEKISRGEMVIEYVGEVIRAQVAEKREKAYERQGIGSSYLFRIDEDLVVDATKKGNLGRLINHSCDPNCTAKIITIQGVKKIVIYAKQDIDLGDEITYDYHFPIEQDKIPCLCGSAKCRGYLN